MRRTRSAARRLESTTAARGKRSVPEVKVVTVACKILKRLAMVAAVASATTLRPALAQNTSQPPSPPAAPTTAAGGLGNSVPTLLGTLNGGDATPQAERDEAAKRLLVIGTPDAINALRQVLVNTGNRAGQLAVARALADGPVPDPAFVIPLHAVIGNDAYTSEAAARALANLRSEPEARLYLLRAARDEEHRYPNTSRAAVIRSLAPLADKQAAGLLVSIATGDAEPAAIRNAAADELVEMSGDAMRGRDVQLWKEWWATQSAKADDQFEREMLEIRAARLDRVEPKLDRLVAEVRSAYRDRFQDAPAAAKEAILLSYLRSPESEVRAIGAGVIVNLFTESKPIPPSAQAYLRTMVGDSDEQVRLRVAEALREINDRDAVDAVVAQLKVERVPAVRTALAQALVPMGDARAVQPLLALLKEPDPSVVQAAAQALEGLRDRIPQQQDSKLATEISQALDAALSRTDGAGNGALRESIASAMVAWASPQVFRTFVELVKPNQPPRMRRLALEYFGQMGPAEGWPAENIIRSGALDDPDATIRLAAVEALGMTAKAQNAQQLYDRTLAEVERDERVRTAAWNGLAALFPREIDAGQLSAWADKFADQPERRLTILQVLKEKLIAANANRDDIAAVQQNIGAAFMAIKDYAHAASAFNAALEQGVQQNQFREFLVTQLLDAYLLGKDYANATKFGAEMIRQAQQNQSRIGPAILREARRLAAESPEDALRLIELAFKMDPALADNYARQLREIESQVRDKVQEAPAAAPSAPAP